MVKGRGLRFSTFRLYPNDVQAAALEQTHALHCRVWNALLEEHQRRYKAQEPSLGFAGMCKEFTISLFFAKVVSRNNAWHNGISSKATINTDGIWQANIRLNRKRDHLNR